MYRNVKVILKFVAGIIFSCLLAYTLTFVLIEMSDRDPVDTSLRNSDPFFQFDATTYRKLYLDRARLIGYDLPSFYFSWKPVAMKNVDLQKHTMSERAFYLYWAQYFAESISFDDFYENIEKNYFLQKSGLNIWSIRSEEEIKRFSDLGKWSSRPLLQIPRPEWHGISNRFHRGMEGLIQPWKFRSALSLQPVWYAIQYNLIYTFVISASGLAIILLFSIFIVEFIVLGSGRRVKNIALIFFDAIYAIPVFWLSTLFILFGTYMASKSWGSWIALPGIFTVRPQSNVWQQMAENVSNLFWPVLVIVLNGLGYMIYYIHTVARSERQKMYFAAFRMKGYSDKEINRLFVRRRVYYSIVSLLPMLLASLIAGSVVIEVIFNLPGMGSLLFRAVNHADWNLVYAVVIMSAAILWSGYYLSDYLQKKWVEGYGS